MKELGIKILLLPLALAFSCLLAGVYGAVHNQISFTVAPQYFYEFKFFQFQIPPKLQNRLGASIIGWRASWWMGLIIAVPVYTLCLFIKGIPAVIRAFAAAALTAVLTALAIGLAALLYGYLNFSPTDLPIWMEGRDVSDPVAFARSGNMHNFSYLGGLIGMVAGCGVVIARATASRRKPARM